MNKFKLAIAATVAVAGFAGSAVAASGTLHIYNWTEYTDPGVIEKFEKETGIKVVVDTYDNNETLLAKLQSGATGYDLVVPSQNFVPVMIHEGLLQKVDIKSLPNYTNVYDRFKNPEWDPNQEYTAPWHWGTTSFSYRSDLYSGKGESLKEYFEPMEGTRIQSFNSPDEVVNLAHLYLGSEFCSENSDDMKAVYELLAGQKPFVVNFNAETMNDMMATGEVTMTTHWNGFSLIGRQEANENITYAYPKEGVVGWLDSLVVPTGAQNVEAALAFMNFMMAPENMGPHTTAMGYSNAIKGAEKYVDASVATAPELNAPADVKIKFAPACGAKAQKLVDKVWTRLLQ